MPSEQFEEYQAAVVPGLQEVYAGVEPSRSPCERCDGSGRARGRPCLGCGGAGVRPLPLAELVLVEAVFYRERAIGDLSGFQQALGDVLEVSGVIANDRLIALWSPPGDGGLPLRKDAARPRTELTIVEVPRRQLDLGMVANG